MKRILSFLSGAIVGALVGATLALLFAPASGEGVREQLRQRAMALQEEVKKAAAERRAELEEQLSSLRTPQKPGKA